jgi:TP901 family phage tail tape measure protein
MAEELQGASPRLGADVVIEFEKSIKNIQDFANQMSLLDDRFGRLENRIDNMRNAVSGLTAQTNKTTGSNLRRTIEQEINNLIMQNGVALSAVGNAPIKVKQETVRHLFGRVEAELNRAILRQIGNIEVKIDPNFNNGVIPIGKDEFDELNKEIARLVKIQTQNLINSIKKTGAGLLSHEDLNGLKMQIGRGTVATILQNIKEQIKPLILNPDINSKDVKLTFTQKDLEKLLGQVKTHVKNALDFDFQGVLNKGNDVDGEIYKTARRIDSIITNYVEEMRRGLGTIDPRQVQVPIDRLHRRLQQYIAKDLQTTPEQLRNVLQHISVGDMMGYELRRQFNSLERTVNSKVTSGTSKMMTELRREVNRVQITPDTNLTYYLIDEINKLNNQIIRKVREQVDNQFRHMKAEVEAVNTAPRSINRSGRIRSMSQGYGGGNNTTVINNYGSNGGQQERRNFMQYADPYARRDAYFSSFGLENAVINTFRHILAGGIVGAPMAAVYEAIETFKTSQQEQLKIFQNMSMKSEYKNPVTGKPDLGRVETAVQTDLMPYVKSMSGFYGIDYGQMSQVAAVASRLTKDMEEARQFVDYASQIYRIDNESDLVNTIAPGLEAIMAQFKISVWELDDVVKAFAVATNVTKATTDEVINALTRSGSSFASVGVKPEDAVALSALAIQTSGQSGENVGQMFKTLNARITMPSVVNKLKGYGIDVYERDSMGLKQIRPMIEILAEVSEKVHSGKMGTKDTADIFLGMGGGYQYQKLMSFIEGMHKAGADTEDLNFFHIKKEIEAFKQDPDRLREMMARTMASPTVTMERAGVSVNNSLVSVLEKMTPDIQILAKEITNLSDGLKNNSGLIAELIAILGNALIGFGALYGYRKMKEVTGYEKHRENAAAERRFFGGDRLFGERDRRYGAVDFLTNRVFSNNADPSVFANLGNRDFYRAARRNETLSRYFDELSNLSLDRMREIRRYIQDRNGLVDNLPELFAVMDESRGYRRQQENLTADEIHRRSAYTARELTGSRSVATVFAQNFATDLVDMLSNRQRFDSLSGQDRGTATRLARMNDGDRRDFEAFLNQSYRSVGNTINDMEGLNRALDEYEQRNRQAMLTSRQSSEQYRELSRAVRQVEDSIGSGRNRMDDFLRLMDTVPDRLRGAGGAFMEFARTLRGFAIQAAVLTTIGDVISSNFESATLSPLQEKVRDMKNSTTGAADEFVGQSTETNPIFKLIRRAYGYYNDFVDVFTSGNTEVGNYDVTQFQVEFTRWLKEKYGSGDWKKVIEELNKKNPKENMDLAKLTRQYLEDSGKYGQLQDLEEEQFTQEYGKFAIAEEEQRRRKEREQDARKTWRERMLEEGKYDYLATETIKEDIKEAQQNAQRESQLNLVKASLRGVKMDSEEYLKLRLQGIAKERESYRTQMKDLDDFIKVRENDLKELEKSGKRYMVDPKTGKKVETPEYIKTRKSIEDANDTKKELQKEFELDDKKKALEAQQITTDFYINRAQKAVSRAQTQKQYSDLLAGLRMNTESPAYIDAQISTSKEMINNMKSELARLEGMNLADPEGKLQDAILSLKSQIAGAQMEVKNLRLQRLQAWRNDFNKNMDEIDIKYLRERVNLGAGLSDDSPIAKNLRIRELQDRKTEIEKTIAARKADMSNTKDKQELDQIMKDIRELTKQSLQAQLGIYQEMKSTTGTFNLPDGVRVMSQYDYLASKGTHSNFTIQQGDMYVNITLPNITDKSGSKQIADVGYQLGKGLSDGRSASLRTQLNGSPWGYRTI